MSDERKDCKKKLKKKTYKKLSKFDKIIPKIFMYNIFVKLTKSTTKCEQCFLRYLFFDFSPHFVKNLLILLANVYSL